MSALDKKDDVAYFCPECGSPSLDLPVLDGGAVTCRACEWSGRMQDLMGTPIKHGMGSKEEIAQALMGDLRTVLAKHCATPVGMFLMQWGFIDVVETNKGKIINPRQLGRYMTAISGAVLTAIIAEREKMAKERADGS